MSGAGTALSPGGTIGILGGGQLARMLALAAARLGLRCHIYSDDPESPAFEVAASEMRGDYEDLDKLSLFARHVDVVTYEFENVPVAAARHLARAKPVRPGPLALEVAQDRLTEKSFIARLGIPVAPYRAIEGAADLDAAMRWLGEPAILKTRRLGYDGKGQVRIAPGDPLEAGFAAIGRRPAVLEARLDFVAEISVLAVRGLDGAVATYDIPANTHRDGILRRSDVPASLPPAVADEARAMAVAIAAALDYVGVLAVEMFVLDEAAPHRLVVNEIAPRVHNSGHWTIDACAASQFESHVRAVAGWPLAATARHSDAVMENLIGPEHAGWPALAAEPGACLHLYGKREAREGRKMGHVTRLSRRADR